ncbi:MAG: type I secretion C-terminal target domain-containing protein, partial [Micavibrio aeruginosavorus]|nr:type I secretion C-terminal target domain-containing protein [Micavibrio aeruginosavorus]
ASGTTLNGVAGHLVQITSATENSYIDTLTGTNDVWMGGTDFATEGVWLFSGGVLNGLQFWQGTSTGSAQNGFYTNWAASQPNNSGGGGSQYQSFLDGGTWDDIRSTGSSKQTYVIEWEGSQVLAPTNTTTLAGGDGLDLLYGAAGQDIFLFEAASAFNNIDKVYNYGIDDLDKLDIGDLLSGYVAGTSDDDLFARFVVSGADLLLQVDANGATGGSSYTSVAQLMGLGGTTLNVEEMVANGFLVMT